MKNLKSLIISVLIVIMSCGFAYAGEGVLTVSAEAEDGVITVRGSAPDGVKTLVAVKIADPNGKIIYMNDKYSEDDGSFSFVMPIAEKIKGSYSVWASCLGCENAKCEAYLDVKSENEILAFSVDGVPGKISGTSVTVETTGRIGESAAKFALSEKAHAEVDGVIQESGVTVNDFRHNVKYTVIAEDGTSQVYTVRVSKKESSSGGGGGGSSSGSKKNNSSEVRVITPAADGKAEQESAPSFNDVEKNHWAYKAVEALTSKGIINGTGKNEFSPDKNISREEFVKMIITASGKSPIYTDSAFTDVDKDSWYAPYVYSAVKEGYIKGESETLFGSGKNITREDMAVILVRCGGEKINSSSREYVPFTDDADISDYAKEAVAALFKGGFADGNGDGTFAPKAFATRAEAAKLIYKIFG